MTIWYSFNNLVEHILPNKEDAFRVSEMILKNKQQLSEYKQMQGEIADKENQSLRFNDILDKRLIWVTAVEVVVIVGVFVAELMVLNRYLNSKEIV